MLEQLTQMDRISQIQNGVEQVSTTSRKLESVWRTTFKQVNDAIPVSRQRAANTYDLPQVFSENQDELVADLMRKAKEIEYLIGTLPLPESTVDQGLRLEQLEKKMQIANDEYRSALERTRALHSHINEMLQRLLSDGEQISSMGGST
ncbi:hypothetical protein Clacol_008220 [Clathrus columnatus]|uniref:Mediator of RNA polymerase II transcription subunit 21 n=1 Tax=Clathrus columnatus TaxID=1419009 RepID=A0AAV5AMP7_9AGAM|nr:hypothetical protein Clacol_008220 [Clathrus columnatus]